MGFVRSVVRAVSSFFSPSIPQMAQPQLPAASQPSITQASREAEREPARQATREATSTERRVAAVQGQPNLTNVLAGDTEGATNERARRRALGV